jgi:hypothetical protein
VLARAGHGEGRSPSRLLVGGVDGRLHLVPIGTGAPAGEHFVQFLEHRVRAA